MGSVRTDTSGGDGFPAWVGGSYTKLTTLRYGENPHQAAALYAAAYNRNPEFYSFYRSLQAYRASLGKEGDVMVVSPDSEFFRYFEDPLGKGRQSRPAPVTPEQ